MLRTILILVVKRSAGSFHPGKVRQMLTYHAVDGQELEKNQTLPFMTL